jgi:hypothetical protein
MAYAQNFVTNFFGILGSKKNWIQMLRLGPTKIYDAFGEP